MQFSVGHPVQFQTRHPLSQDIFHKWGRNGNKQVWRCEFRWRMATATAGPLSTSHREMCRYGHGSSLGIQCEMRGTLSIGGGAVAPRRWSWGRSVESTDHSSDQRSAVRTWTCHHVGSPGSEVPDLFLWPPRTPPPPTPGPPALPASPPRRKSESNYFVYPKSRRFALKPTIPLLALRFVPIFPTTTIFVPSNNFKT